jgi:hypothetical protein
MISGMWSFASGRRLASIEHAGQAAAARTAACTRRLGSGPAHDARFPPTARHREPVSEVAVGRFVLNTQAPHPKALGENTLQYATRKCGRKLKCNNYSGATP